jgi:hypothetical protein
MILEEKFCKHYHNDNLFHFLRYLQGYIKKQVKVEKKRCPKYYLYKRNGWGHRHVAERL